MKEEKNNINWHNATGPIGYNMTNDYMFRMVLQSQNEVLKGLISSMMHIPLSKIDKVGIANPIAPGKYIEDKYFILDIKINLNDNTIINLKMQVTNYNNWENRSLSYLCRTFDNVQKGEDYNSVNAVTHIDFLDYDLFSDEVEFYSTYMLQNVKTHKIYNDKFRLNVLSLNQIKIATKEDKKWHIDEWASLFKATTWEKLKMIAEKDKVYSEAANSIYIQNSDETVRTMCKAREEAIFHEQYMQNQLTKAKADRDEAVLHAKHTKKQMAEKDAKLSQQADLIAQLQAELAELKSKEK